MSQPATPSSSPIARRIVRGGVWVAARFGASQLAGFVQVIVVARILPPQQIGLLGIASMILAVASALTQTGFEAAIVHRKELKELELHVAWTAILLRGLVLSAGMAVLAPLLARFFDEPAVGPIVIALAGITAFEGLASMSLVMFRRALDFRRIFLLQSTAQALEIAATVAVAIALRTVWALVIGRAVGAAVRVVLSYALHAHRPRFAFNRVALDSLVDYGKWVTLSSTTALALMHADNFYVAKVLGAEQLAYYQYAFRLSNLPASTLNEILGALLFPAFVAVRAQPDKLSLLYGRTLSLTILVGIPAAALIWVLAPELTLALLGARWLPVVDIARLLSLFGFVRALGAPAIPFFMATNRPALRAKFQLAQIAIFAVAVVPLGARYGTAGVAVATTLYGAVHIVSMVMCLRLAGLTPGVIALPFLFGALAAGSAAIVVYRVAEHVGDASLVGLALLGGLGAAVYFAVLAALDPLTGGRYRKELRDITKQINF